MSTAEKSGLWTKPYILLSVTNFFAWLSYNMITPVLTGYMGTLGASVSICGIVGGLFAFTSLFSRPVSGVLADTKNRKHLMAGFTVLMTISLLLYSVIPSIPVIICFRGLHGVAFGISSTASLVLVSESVPEKRMGEAISYYGLMSVASMAIGPSLGIWLSSTAGYRVCMLVGTVMLSIASIASLLYPYTPPEKKVEQQGKRKLVIAEKSLIGLSGVNASFTMMNGVVSTFLVAFAAERAISNVDLHFTVNAVVLIATRILLAKKMNQWSLGKNLYPAFVCGVATLLLIGNAWSLPVLLIAGCTKAIAQGMSQPALQTEAFKSVPPEKRGLASSTMYIGGDLGQAVGPILGGALAEQAGYGTMYMLCAIPIAAAWVYFVLREKKKKEDSRR
ncbi:MAG: MFS transporter [Eubacteriales bacterium]|nr:MFS transporter [Eubacteriales bacterium]